MNEKILRAAGFGKQVDMVRKGLCPTCGKDMKNERFKDELSIKEFTISGMCQNCQDETFR